MDVDTPTPQPNTGPLGLDPVIAGTAFCVLSALAYTAANVCLRTLAVDCDPAWVTCMKAAVSVVTVGLWLLLRAYAGRTKWPPLRVVVTLILVGLVVQLAGNLSLQWAFGVVGLAISVTMVFGIMLIASAVMGLIVLGERVSWRSAGAIGLLIGSIVLLSFGAGAAHRSVAAMSEVTTSPLLVALGFGAACLAGIAYATMSVVIRHTVNNAVSPATIIFVTTAVGVLTTGSLSIWRLGVPELLNTRPGDLAVMLAAGTFNLFAFLLLIKGLQLTTVVHANVLNASQVAMCAVAGMLLFAEPPGLALLLGVCLTVTAMILIDRPSGEEGAAIIE